jgi:hypothetical protein
LTLDGRPERVEKLVPFPDRNLLDDPDDLVRTTMCMRANVSVAGTDTPRPFGLQYGTEVPRPIINVA